MLWFTSFKMYEKSFPNKRYQETIKFLESVTPAPANILDLGVRNPFSEVMEKHGYTVTNTTGEDLDVETEVVQNTSAEIVTAFEIFEHLVAPFNVLRDINTRKLVASVPLRLWFSPAYRSKNDEWDRHYHEFEDWQFEWLLEKAGWEIKKRHKWTNPVNKVGLRPLLRKFTPRYYAVYAEKKS